MHRFVVAQLCTWGAQGGTWGAQGGKLELEHMSRFLHTGGECILSWRIISIRMQTQQECAKAGGTMQQRIGEIKSARNGLDLVECGSLY